MSRTRRDVLHDVATTFEETLDKLQVIWDKIGIQGDQRGARTDVVLDHMKNLLSEMVKEEEALMNKLIFNVSKYSEELRKLCLELKLPPHESDPSLTILQMEKELQMRCSNLRKEKTERLVRLKDLKSADQSLCDVMCTTPYYIPSGAVPSRDQLRELESHVQSLTAEKSRRFSIYKSTKDSISKLLDDLEQNPNTSFEKDIVYEEEDAFLLTQENMKALKIYHEELVKKQNENYALAKTLRERVDQLWVRLEITPAERNKFNTEHTGFKPKTIAALREEISRCELLKLENMQKVIQATQRELEEWWDRCYYSPEQRHRFKPYFEDEFTEESLDAHDQEVQRVKEYYQQYHELFDRVAKRQKLWGEFLEFERQASDPNRFFKRGCNLLKEEAKRKKIMKELPRVEMEMMEAIEIWERDNGKEFLMEGVSFKQYVEKQWQDYNIQKDKEKHQRHQAKVKQTEEEMLYGSRPAAITPGKRRFAGTPSSKTPLKMRKIEDDSATSTFMANSTTSSTASSRGGTLSRVGTLRRGATAAGSPRAHPHKSGTSRYPAKFDETKTPGSISRLAKTPNRTLAKTPNRTMSKTPNHTRMFSSPVCMPPRSVGRSRLTTKTGGLTTAQGSPRKALSQRNLASNDTLFSQTTVSEKKQADASTISLASVGPYNDFARGLNHKTRENCRSSVVPKPAAFF